MPRKSFLLLRAAVRALLAGVCLGFGAIGACALEEGGAGTARIRPHRFAEDACRVIAEEAVRRDLPAPFFARLIWRESLFNPRVVSPKGAQGIAQFIEATAVERGLANPFDPAPALAASAHYLADLKAQFGSVGLAAAAYNAGPMRVASWLAGDSGLPLETQDYVQWITGHSAEEWVGAKKPLALLPVADKLSFEDACERLAARALTAKLPNGPLRLAGWQKLFNAGLGIKLVKASAPGRIRLIIEVPRRPASKN